MNTRIRNRAIILLVTMITIISASLGLRADTGVCGGASITLPFTDVPSTNMFFCSIAEAYFSALTNGTSATTFSPSSNVTREQMAALLSRGLDQSLNRASRRAALDQFWTPQTPINLGFTDVGVFPQLVKADGADIWVANQDSASVSRVRASDGAVLGTWTGATGAFGVIVAVGKVFVGGDIAPFGRLYQIDPTQPPGLVTSVSSLLGPGPQGIAFDGERIWTANFGGSVSIVSLQLGVGSTNVTTGFVQPVGILYDGTNIWVTDQGDSSLKKLSSTGAILLTVSLAGNSFMRFPAFDGTNIWVPNLGTNSLSVVRATGALSGTVLATITGNGLSAPVQAAFDGSRILVTNLGGSVSLWKASDLTPIGNISTGAATEPFGVCSDGLNFWITIRNTNQLARF